MSESKKTLVQLVAVAALTIFGLSPLKAGDAENIFPLVQDAPWWEQSLTYTLVFKPLSNTTRLPSDYARSVSNYGQTADVYGQSAACCIYGGYGQRCSGRLSSLVAGDGGCFRNHAYYGTCSCCCCCVHGSCYNHWSGAISYAETRGAFDYSTAFGTVRTSSRFHQLQTPESANKSPTSSASETTEEESPK